jgi:hypothetical protein
VGGATKEGYDKYMGHLRQQERVLQRRENAKRMRTPMTPKEKWALEAQGHSRFSELPVSERSQLESERDSMWSQIPAHLQDKARKLAGR